MPTRDDPSRRPTRSPRVDGRNRRQISPQLPEADVDGPAAIRPADVAALLRLARSLHEPGLEPADRKRRLIEGLCRVTGASRGLCVVAHLDEQTGRRTVLSTVVAGADEVPTGGAEGVLAARQFGAASVESTAAKAVVADDQPGNAADDHARFGAADERTAADDARGDAATHPGGTNGRVPGASPHAAAGAWSDSPDAHALRRAAGIDRCIDSFVALRGLHVVAWLAVGRPPGDGRRFAAAHRAAIEVMHAESAWVYAPDLLLASADAVALTARQRDILRHLLAGAGEKQVATLVGLSPNTVHHHVKGLYRRLGVSSRGELLARWITPA